jgi:DNA-binding transcriptional ArsR family regulator
MKPKNIAEIMKALCSDKRVRIIDMLKDGPCCVSIIATRLNISKPATSQHLQILKSIGVVDNEREGLNIHYCLCPERLDELIEIVKSVCCREERCCRNGESPAKKEEG